MARSEIFSTCIHSFSDACEKRIAKQLDEKRIVLTNGCFDLLHAGHIYSLQKAAELGDELWIALNSDASVRSLKGESRPIFSQMERAYMLNALECVSLIFLFEGDNLSKEILNLKPDIYVKSSDYSLETLNHKEKKSLESVGADIHFVPHIDGFSTTITLNKVQNT